MASIAHVKLQPFFFLPLGLRSATWTLLLTQPQAHIANCSLKEATRGMTYEGRCRQKRSGPVGSKHE